MAGSGETVTYRQLDEQSQPHRATVPLLGLKAGDHIALFL
jgi:long-chain acyl-CoA synthetase